MRSLPGRDLRPTADKLRETLFNVLTAGNSSALEETVWLDLFAGTGAVGIEALSRGAGLVYFVESSAHVASLVQQNLQSLDVDARFHILKQDTGRALKELQDRGVAGDFIFLDPPYRMRPAYQQTLQFLSGSRLLQPRAIVIAEHEKRFDPGEEFASLRRYRKLEQGDAALSFYRLTKT